MQISDLMVGNWIMFNGITYKIVKIIGDDVVLDKPGVTTNENYIIAKVSDCEAVRLTTDILIESGFLQAKERFALDSGNDMIVLTRNDDEDNFSLTIGVCNLHQVIDTVHGLQQLLKAHGYNVNIDLAKEHCEYKTGSWVEFDGMDRQIAQVDTIGNTYTIKDNEDSEKYSVCKYTDIKPIEITEEMLLKFKFNKDDDGSLVLEEVDEYMSSSIRYKNGEWTMVNRIDNKSYNGKIKFVHQLQNICILTNVHIDIDLENERTEMDKMLDAVFK